MARSEAPHAHFNRYRVCMKELTINVHCEGERRTMGWSDRFRYHAGLIRGLVTFECITFYGLFGNYGGNKE